MSLIGTNTAHVRYNGQSHDIPFDDFFRSDRLERVGVDPDKVSSVSDLSDAQINRLLSHFFDKPDNEFAGYVIDRESTGNITIRPEAVFG